MFLMLIFKYMDSTIGAFLELCPEFRTGGHARTGVKLVLES